MPFLSVYDSFPANLEYGKLVLVAYAGIDTNVLDLLNPGLYRSFKGPALEILASTIQYKS